MRVFISGPMTGKEDYNRAAFDAQADALRAMGHTVFNPACLIDTSEGWDKHALMRIDLAALRECDAIFQLDGWEESEGAAMERDYAVKWGKAVMRP